MEFYMYADRFIAAGVSNGMPKELLARLTDIVEAAKNTLPYTAPERLMQRAVDFKMEMMNLVGRHNPSEDSPWFTEMYNVFREVKIC